MTDEVTTVLGPVAAQKLGHVQPHEHLLSDIRRYLLEAGPILDAPITLDNYFESRVDRNNAMDFVLDDVDTAVAELALFAEAGGGTVVDVTPAGAGRDPLALRAIAERTGVHVVMGSGYYIAAFHPPEVATLSEAEITEQIVTDLCVGVDATGVRAGVIGEIGMSWPPHPDEEKVLRAAAAAQRDTDAALFVHPGRHAEAPAHHLRLLRDSGANLERTVMCHIDRTLFDLDAMLAVADTGCVLEFDLFGTESSYYPQDPSVDLPNDGMRVGYLTALIAAGHGDHLVISEDVCRKTQLVRHGGEGYAHILRRVLPLMGARGVSPDDIHRITRTTPARLLAKE